MKLKDILVANAGEEYKNKNLVIPPYLDTSENCEMLNRIVFMFGEGVRFTSESTWAGVDRAYEARKQLFKLFANTLLK